METVNIIDENSEKILEKDSGKFTYSDNFSERILKGTNDDDAYLMLIPYCALA